MTETLKFVGQSLNEDVKEQLSQLSSSVEYIYEDSRVAITADYQPGRLQVYVNKHGYVTDLIFG